MIRGGIAFPGGATMSDLGTLGGTRSEAWAINSSGQVVGWAQPAGNSAFRAFLYSGGVMHDLGTLNTNSGNAGSFAYGINDVGAVVGQTATNGDYGAAFLYRDGVMYDLNFSIEGSSGWQLLAAAGINNNGQITGWGYFEGQARSFVLTPVPEPSSVFLSLLAAIGALGVGYRRLRPTMASVEIRATESCLIGKVRDPDQFAYSAPRGE